jgi:RNA polymerase sigma-70 factor (ECF subfamily)
VFNEGYVSSSADRTHDRDLAADAEWLASLPATLLPAEPEATGLLALIRLHPARAAARFDARDELVRLRDHDRARWDGPAITAATDLLVRAARARRPGPYQLQAAIVAGHAEAPRWEAADWAQIVALSAQLHRAAPSPVTQLHRAVALRYRDGLAAALAELESLAGPLERYHLFHASRAELLRDVGDRDAARRALALTANPAQRHLLTRRLAR